MAISAIGATSAIRPTFAQALRRLSGSAAAAFGAVRPVSGGNPTRNHASRSSAQVTPTDHTTSSASPANASVVSELVTSHAGGAVTTITTYQDGHSTARTAFARFTATGEMDTSHGGIGQLVNLLV